MFFFFCFKQKTAYEMRISDWSSDVCSSDLALVRLPMLQKERDTRAGLDTGGFISGYRGSPLGSYDQELWRAKDLLESMDVLFQPGVHEDLPATAGWGTQLLAGVPG